MAGSPCLAYVGKGWREGGWNSLLLLRLSALSAGGRGSEEEPNFAW